MLSMILALILVNPASLSTAQSAEIQKVEKRLLAPCCYTQSIAEHGSDIAVQMRGEVAEMVADGQSEREIVEHYRSIYGNRILIVPDGITGKILFGLPVAIALLACLVLFFCFRKMLRSRRYEHIREVSQASPPLSDSLKKKIDRELGDAS
ncbi:MAG TPA: cytochrome c-type biogenesis protein CcmH [Candidatus Solibacter sp.]|nr:cytochrome c-type biogenesis protein CcmH [Candidatus Solibacter sp.]